MHIFLSFMLLRLVPSCLNILGRRDKKTQKSKSTQKPESKGPLMVSLHYTSLSTQTKAPYFDLGGREDFHPRSSITLFNIIRIYTEDLVSYWTW